ncbi:MAG: hypothetical protein RLZZ444_3971 [Pseudomonadota bacterium]|jgi:hypothetical protein
MVYRRFPHTRTERFGALDLMPGRGGVMGSAIDPVASMQAIDNDTLKGLAGQVRSMLEAVVAEI